jgi:hypothetical protein
MWKAVFLGAVLAVSLAASAHAMTVDDVVGMLQAGIGEDVILKAVDATGDQMVITPDDLVAMKDAGASDAFLDDLLDRTTGARPNAGYNYPYGSPGYGSPSYLSLGIVYDPFDYYFACSPYYYAYVSPFRFSYSWWYYGAPAHHAWWEPWDGYRVRYYRAHWGARAIWDRGYRPIRAHVPAYGPIGKEGNRYAFGRPGIARTGGRPTPVWGRQASGDRSRRLEYSSPPERRPADRGARAPIWGRPGDSRGTQASPPGRSGSEVRQPDRGNARPPAEGSRGGGAPPSAPPRRVWSR